MEQPIVQIKKAVTALLKGLDPETDIFFEEIKGTGDRHGIAIPKTWYFVDFISVGNQLVDKFFTDTGVMVDIAYHDEHESNTAYLVKGAQIDAAVRPVFHFGDRHITVSDANINVVDHVLHYGFTIRFRQAWEQPNEFECMGELEVAARNDWS